jgi:hypothetical protein
VIVTAPVVSKVWVIVAVANAGINGDDEFRFAAAVGTTCTALPICVPFALKMMVPVGPAPLLIVLTLAVSVTGVVVLMLDAGAAVTPIVVVAAVMVTACAGDVLAVKLLSPE